MDFGALPPEINSTRMYSGPGGGPLLAAASAWDQLAGDVYSAAASYTSVVSALTGGPWQGAASVSMTAAASAYVQWLHATAALVEQTATQAKAAVAAYETARAMTVPPPLVAANRSLLASLVATNLLGQNAAAIATTEALYAQMWAQDATAMYGYAAAAATASALTPFTSPQPATNPAGSAGQAAAVGQATGTSAATNTQAVLSQAMTATPTALQQLATPLSSVASSVPSLNQSMSSISPALSMTSSAGWISSALLSNANQLKSLIPAAGAVSHAASGGSGLAGGLASGAGASRPTGLSGLGFGGTGTAVSATAGQANSVGALAVPPAWTTAAGGISPAPTALPGVTLSAATTGNAGAPANLLGAAPLTGMAARPTSAAASRPEFRLEAPKVIPHSPAIG